MDENNISGGYIPFRALDEDALNVFNEAMAGFTGKKHEPKQVATQVVNGINYSFICKSSLLNEEGYYTSMIVINKDSAENLNLLDFKILFTL